MDAMRQLLFSRLMRSSHNRLCPDQRTVFPARQNTTSLRSFFPTALLWYSVVIKWSRSPTEGIKENKSRLFLLININFFFVSFFLFSFLAFSRWGRSPNASHRFGSIRPIWWLSVRRSCLMGPLSRRVRQLLLLHKRKGQKINGKNRRDCAVSDLVRHVRLPQSRDPSNSETHKVLSLSTSLFFSLSRLPVFFHQKT